MAGLYLQRSYIFSWARMIVYASPTWELLEILMIGYRVSLRFIIHDSAFRLRLYRDIDDTHFASIIRVPSALPRLLSLRHTIIYRFWCAVSWWGAILPSQVDFIRYACRFQLPAMLYHAPASPDTHYRHIPSPSSLLISSPPRSSRPAPSLLRAFFHIYITLNLTVCQILSSDNRLYTYFLSRTKRQWWVYVLVEFLWFLDEGLCFISIMRHARPSRYRVSEIPLTRFATLRSSLSRLAARHAFRHDNTSDWALYGSMPVYSSRQHASFSAHTAKYNALSSYSSPLVRLIFRFSVCHFIFI